MEGTNNEATFFGTPLESIFRTSKKTIQEYVREIDRHCRYKSVQSQVTRGVVLDDRGPLMDLYEACVQQDAHLAAVLETVESQIIGERYMLARQNSGGKYVKDIEATRKIQGSQFTKIIQGIVEAKWYGYTVLEIMPDINPLTGKLAEVNIVERRNVLANQGRVVQRQGQWNPGWDLDSAQYKTNYVLINTGTLGLFSATTPLILAKKFTLANYVNFSHTYGQPIIHGKTESESTADRQRLAQNIANAAQNKIIVTGLNDSVDVKTFTMSNSEHIYSSLMDFVNKEVSNLIVGSESMAGETQSYVGSTTAHQDIFRERIDTYRGYIEDTMNEEILPRLVQMGYLPDGLEFKYANRAEMSNKDKIALYSFITDKYEVAPDEIEKEFGIIVGKQFNSIAAAAIGDDGDGTTGQRGSHDRGIMSDEEYYKRFGHRRGEKKKDSSGAEGSVNFLSEEE
jgi:hypothetical protein